MLNSNSQNLAAKRGSQVPINSASKILYLGKKPVKIEQTEKIQPVFFPVSLFYLKYTRLRQQSVLMLQHCAILSQLNRHQDALDISKSTALLIKDITEIAGIIIK
jgi:hypothetical protein